MPDLSGRGPIGQKQPKPPNKPRKALLKVSAKRGAYMASQARIDGMAHMERVKCLPCICCGAHGPSEAHHVTGDGLPRDDLRVISLCFDCHRGQNGYHNAKRAWVERHGPDYMLLPRVAEMLSCR